MNPRLAALLVALLLLVTLAVRVPALYLLDALVLLMMGASALWGRYCLSAVTYARQFGATRLFCGEETDLWIELVNAKPLPLPWLNITDEVAREAAIHGPASGLELQPSSDPQRRLLVNTLSVRWYERVRRHYRVRFNQRGLFDFGPVVLSSGDLFGFRTRYLDLALRERLIVYPKIVPLTHLPLPAARPLGDYALRRRVTADPLRLAGTRDYQPGDNPRHLHWKATARRGILQTKLFDPSAAHQVLIFLNTHTLDYAFAGVVADYLETGIVVAASLANAALDARYPVGLFTNGASRESQRRVRLPASRHTAQLIHILEVLAQLSPLAFQSFEDVVRLESASLPYGATLLIITAVVTAGLLSALLDARAQGHPVVLIFIQPLLAGDTLERPSASQRLLRDTDLTVHTVTQNWTDLETLTLD
jgi:uncharacterized protein (DUF58 family)